MRKLLVALAVLVLSTTGYTQILEPVKWTTSVEKVSNTEYDLITKATIESGWHLYSQTVPEGESNSNVILFMMIVKVTFTIVGNTSEEEGHTVNDPVFKMEIKYF